MGAVDYLPNYTYEEYKLWENEWELIDGIPYSMSPAPMIKHQSISNNIAWELKESLGSCKFCKALLPVDWKISENTIVQPDNSVICHEPKNEAYLSEAPEIIFEILSKSTAKKDLNLKYDLYEQEGVKFYIIVNPDDEVAKIYKLHDGKYIKVCDTHSEVVDLSTEKCSIKFNFSKIF
ncbi:MAG: Uma2 family endonuclease [Helicobacteraceae bacterium]|nr:Uma2 family endonuclease [Helicobacteraceae bacterium]